MSTPPNVTAAASEAHAPARQPDFIAVLGNWAVEHADFLTALTHKMTQSGHPAKKLTENTVWDLIADTWSPDWAQAKTQLGIAANDLFERQKPENIPLGAIGLALDAGELDQSEKRYRDALADFTVINEALRQDTQLSRLLETICEIAETVEASQAVTAKTQKLHNSFKVADKAATKEKPTKKGFRAYVDLVFGRKPAEPVPAPVTVEATATKAPVNTPAANV